MEYPKKIMSISELAELGMSKKVLRKWIHIRGFPCFRATPKGKVYINTEYLDAWMIRKGIKKRDAIG